MSSNENSMQQKRLITEISIRNYINNITCIDKILNEITT